MRSTLMQTKRLVLVGAATVMCTAAFAQVGALKPTFVVRAGGIYALDKDVRDAASDYGFTVGGSYLLPMKGFLSTPVSPSTPSLDLDYYRVEGHGNKLDSFDITYTERAFLKPVVVNTGFYVGAGVGVAFAHISGKTTTTVDDGGGENALVTTTSHFSKSKTSIAGQLIAGYAFSANGTLEAFLRIAPEIEGVGQNAFGLRAGIKF